MGIYLRLRERTYVYVIRLRERSYVSYSILLVTIDSRIKEVRRILVEGGFARNGYLRLRERPYVCYVCT